MATVNLNSGTGSGTTPAASTVSNGRYWGLASGLDVDSIVTSLVSDKQSQIDKANQQKQTLQWQQSAYQSVISSLNTFRDTYLSIIGSNNILSSNTYATYNAVSDNAAISVKANADATSAAHVLKVTQSALASSVTGGEIGTQITGKAASLAALDGESFNITVDGVTKTITMHATDSYVDANGNTQTDLAGVLQSKINTALGINKVQVTDDGSGNLSIGSGFGYQSVISVTGAASNTIAGLGQMTTYTADDLKALFGGQSFSLTAGSVTKTISFSDTDDFSDITALFQSKFDEQFGAGKVTAKLDDEGKMSFTAAAGTSLAIGKSDSMLPIAALGMIGNVSALPTLGITTGSANRLNLGASISSLFGDSVKADGNGNFNISVNGVSLTLNTSDTLSSAFAKINGSSAQVTISYSSSTGKISLVSNNSGAANQLAYSDSYATGGSAQPSGFFSTLFAGTGTSVAGRDAIFTLDGLNYTRGNNNFTIDGVTYTVNKKIDPTPDGSNAQTANVTLTKDTSSTVKAITDFVNAYNTLVTSINTQITAKPDSNYPPLTDAQKKQMSQSDIDSWNTKAQSGILFSDSTLDSILNSMRSMLYTPVTTSDGKSISIYQIGITTSSDYTKGGTLVIDTNKLTAAVENDPALVQQLFTQTPTTMYSIGGKDQAQRKQSEGLAYRLQDIVNDATSTGVYPFVGSIVALAGPSGDTSTDYAINKELADINDRITQYTQQLKDKKDSLYNQFTQLEVAMERFNAQSSMISSFGSGN